MAEGKTVEYDVHFGVRQRGRKEIREGEEPKPPQVPKGRVPRISKLMALAIRFEKLIEEGDVESFAQLARLGHVSRARITQIMDLRLLAPDIQEDVLRLPRVCSGQNALTEKDLRRICGELLWNRQREMWKKVRPAS
jgi:hypothetical protein